MGKRPKKKIVLILVEGQSDMNALQVVISKLYEKVDENTRVYFRTPIENDHQRGGDITSKFGISAKNINGCLAKLFIAPFLDETGLCPKDISEIIQIVDMDGAYIPDEAIKYDPHLLEDGNEKIHYDDDCIRTGNVQKIKERNLRKVGNISRLAEMKTLKVRPAIIPYSVYYFSCNLDHYIHHDANLPPQEKCRRAQEYSITCAEDLDYFLDTFLKDPDAAGDMSYEESWSFIKDEMNSLRRHTNVDLLFKKLVNDDVET